MANPHEAADRAVDRDVDVVIVGAGLAGLACARAVLAAGRSAVVLEAGDGVGGRVRTDVIDGFRCDRGFQILLTAYPEAVRALDLHALDLRPFEPGALVWFDGGFHRVADPLRQPRHLLATALSPVGTVGDKARILALRRRVLRGDGAALLRGPDRSTIDAIEAAGFSRRMIERFFRPLFGGIQLDPSLATSSRLFEVVFRSLSSGDAAVPALGMQAIPEQMAGSLPAGTVQLGAAVTAVRSDGGRPEVLTDDRRISCRAAVVATQGPAAARLLDLPDPGSKPVSAVWFAADEPPLPGRSLVLDGAASGPVLNLAVMSNVAPRYAPPGRSLVAAACPGPFGGELEAAVRSQLAGWFGAVVQGWDVVHVHHIAHGQPRGEPPLHPKQKVRLGSGRYVSGDHRDTSSIQGALFSGRRCGEAVVADLDGAPC